MEWEEDVKKRFNLMLEKIPIFLRSTAVKKVGGKAEELAKENERDVSEKDMVDAFFAETPFGFHGPMKCDMEELKIDYTKYGYER